MIIVKNKIILQVGGMSCANCAAGIKKQLENNGITEVNVNFSTGEVSYKFSNEYTEKKVENVIKKLGYSVLLVDKGEEKGLSKVEKYFFFTLLFTPFLFLHMFFSTQNFLQNPILQFCLCLPVYIIGILYFGKSAWSSLKSGIPNMDVLIFIGSSAAFFYSIFGSISNYGTPEVHYFLFFETSATIITLVLLGNVLEHRSIKKTTTAISDLSAMQKVVAKKEADEGTIEISYEEININDILIINQGDKIPTDGIITKGSSFIDESMITGESLPVNKSKGDEVIGGTIVIEGSLKIKAIKVGDNTLLSQIIELVKNAQNNKPKIQKIGDQVSAIFVPVVLLIALLTYFFSSNIISYFDIKVIIADPFLRAIAVLVISCPCAMGLATPTAVMVGVGRAAKNGILIKGGDTLEKIATIKNIVFDKTGTLTTGKFIVSEFSVIEGERKEIQNIIYNIEQHSSHPIAKSLCAEFETGSSSLKLSNINEQKGISISAEIGNNTYTIGSSKIYSSKESYDLFVLKNNTLIATLNISDQLKLNTASIISSLHKNNYTTTLLSGDKEEKCNNLAAEIGIKNTYSEQLPQDKITKIETLVKTNATAMVGDGINDAPALTKATIGISLGNATQIAIQSADVILLNNENLNQLPKTMQIGKHTLLTIKQNLFWAFSYNLIAIPIAIIGLLNPMWAALFMAFSDVVVIGNSIRLRYKKIF